MRVFEIATPDGRRIRHEAADAEQATARLHAGYRVTGEVVGAGEGLSGGYVIPAGKGESPLATLLKLHGAELLTWLAEHGFERTGG